MYYNYNNFNQNTIFNFIILERGSGKNYRILEKAAKKKQKYLK